MHQLSPRHGVRYVVVHSALGAEHHRPVRAKRLRGALARLARRKQQVAGGRLRHPGELSGRIRMVLRDHHLTRLVKRQHVDGRLRYGLDPAAYREQRRLDGIFVLVSNDASLSTAAIADAYRQLRDVEEAARCRRRSRSSGRTGTMWNGAYAATSCCACWPISWPRS